MEGVLNRLGAFLTAPDSRLACASAVVLAELAPKDPTLVAKLAEALNHGDAVRRQFVIEALGRIGTAEAAEVLVPLIKAQGPASEQALRAIAHTASAALKPLLKLVGSVPPALLERVAECAARTGEPAAFHSLLAHLAGADVETCRAIRGGLRTAMSSFGDRPKAELQRALAKAFGEAKLTGHFPALIGLMKISGDLGDVSLLKPVLRRTEPAFPPYVRRAALLSVGMLHLSGEQRAKLAPRLLPLLLDSDLANIAEPALEAVRQAHLGPGHSAHVRKLLNSTSPRIREFAMQALAADGSARTLGELIACLDNPDRAVKDEALAALSRAPAAAGPLCERLLQLDGGDAALETARALAPQAAHLPPRLVKALALKYLRVTNGSHGNGPAAETQRAILTVFRGAPLPDLVEAVLGAARKLRQKGEAQRAYEMLKTVSGLYGWGTEAKIEMALAGLCFGPKDLSRSARQADLHLRLLEEVFAADAEPKSLARLVLKDRTLNRRTVFYLGFHFVERMGEEREFGRLLLDALAGSHSEEGREAKEKLIIEGLLKSAGAKTGILEARAKALLAASELGARLGKAAPARSRARSARAARKPARPAPKRKKPARR